MNKIIGLSRSFCYDKILYHLRTGNFLLQFVCKHTSVLLHCGQVKCDSKKRPDNGYPFQVFEQKDSILYSSFISSRLLFVLNRADNIIKYESGHCFSLCIVDVD